ncbi:DUF3302 domain-containing protein [Phreatobacter stygius]|uniref:DUF3302 domain-containing protein n=1 Tax=Phreatobacter stygius TaxID=1940610 RepID=A0A4D7B5H5_9HYPH|nr:DUF3302 domain-containing protein [Phreatobacter stygius]QCI68261.1 DUF3302 domain-containing protein [Phreatobacter stygius]
MLDYVALVILVLVAVALVYGIIAIHDIPYRLARARHHPQQDAIQVAGWVSLFTLHVIWPFLWIWAMAYRPDRGWGIAAGDEAAPAGPAATIAALERRVLVLEQRDLVLEQRDLVLEQRSAPKASA